MYRLVPMRDISSIGQLENSLSKTITQFYSQAIGRGPVETRVYLVADMLIVRLKGKLLPIEKKLLENTGGIGLVKNIRKMLHENVTVAISSLVKQATECNVLSSHCDVSTKTGEMIEVFILDTNYEKELKVRLAAKKADALV